MRVTSPAPREVWQSLADEDPAALASQTPAWLDSICDEGPYVDASRLYEFADGQRCVLPMVRRRRLFTVLSEDSSCPSEWNIGGPLCAPGQCAPAQARAVFDDLARQRVLRTSLRLSPHASPVWAGAVPGAFTRAEHTTYVLDLEGGFDDVWRRKMRGSVRRGVQKAERSGIEVEVDHAGHLVPELWRLYERSIARWSRQQHEPLALTRWRALRANPPSKLATVAQRLGKSCAIWMARRAGEPVAAIVVLRHGQYAKYWRGAMDKEHAAPVRANELLHRLVIEEACAEGRRYYDMGEARPGSPLARFKEGFGAEGLVSAAYRRERLPISAADRALRGSVKRALRFRDP